MTSATFTILSRLYTDPQQQAIFSEDATIESWLRTESALAQAQARYGVISGADADAISSACRLENVSKQRLWESAANVGYPILGLVREVARALPEGPNGRVHLGATTQDIMDTGLALQLTESLQLMASQIEDLGDALSTVVNEHANTLMAARTHAQHAVPTTLGATLATLLEEFSRHRNRLAQARQRVSVISMAGAGGTSAAYGPQAAEIRAEAARLLNLHDTAIPWHTARDNLAEFGHLYATIAASCARIARNIVDLSRTEIAEVFERYDSHRGASSTMPQKVNPISSEAIIGLAQSVAGLASTMPRIQEATHERAAGEWQLEWETLPQIAVLTGSTVVETTSLISGLRVDAERMTSNLELDQGLVMAEAQMIKFAPMLGRERAHDLVYDAAVLAREKDLSLSEAIHNMAQEQNIGLGISAGELASDAYTGQAAAIAEAAATRWKSASRRGRAAIDTDRLVRAEQ